MSRSVSGFTIFQGVIARDLRLALRRKSDSLAVLIFFAVVASLFPLGIGPEQNLLMQIAPGMLWIAALLAAMLSLQKIFSEDFIDGSLDQIALTTLPLPLVVFAKTIAHWISSGLLLALISPILALQFNLPMDTVGVLFLSLLLGTPLLSLIGSIGAGLTLASRGGGTLLALIILPLVSPVLIFGAGAVESYQSGLGVTAHFSLLGAMLAIALFLAPFASAASIRIALE
jgi:heme exporter protein B